MQVKPITLTDHELELEVLGENETLLNPIKQALLADKDVDVAEYIIEHPSLSVPKVFLHTRGKVRPEAVLKRTVKGLVGEFDAFEDAFVAELKKHN